MSSFLEDGVCFAVPGTPRGKARPRVTRNGTYTPKTTKEYQAAIRQAYAIEGHMRHFNGPVKVAIMAMFNSTSLKAAERHRIAAGVFIPYPHRPDADNVAKAVLDALNGVAWDDDAAVTELTVNKVYGREPKTVIFIMNAEERTI